MLIRSRPIKRVCCRVLALLLCGAIANIGMAWWSVWTFRYSEYDRPIWIDMTSEASWWKAHVPMLRSVTVRHGHPNCFHGAGVRVASVCNQPNEGFREPYWVDANCISAGWPLFSLRGFEWTYHPVGDRTIAPKTSWRMALHIDRNPPRKWSSPEWTSPSAALCLESIPLELLPMGFAVNTIVYAAILWLLFAAPFALRRRIRARRGQCPACAYPIGTSNVCTECGKAVTPRV